MPGRTRPSRRLAPLCALAALIVGCDSSVPTQTAVPTPDPFDVVLPSSDEFVPGGVVGVTEWSFGPGLPDEFDLSVRYPSAEAAGDAFGTALAEALSDRSIAPRIRVDAYRQSDALALLVVTEDGTADESVAGSQFALDFVHEPGGWTLYQTWGRFLCRAGVDPTTQFCR